jgi:uncharacterized protein involved in type VI secretion and phage assembly
MIYEHFKSGVPPLARALVVANQDPDKLGRVKVTYPWLGKANAEVPSNWAYVCQPLASKDAGTFFLPEKGDEVLVFFEGGNLDSPIIIGSLYNQKAKPQASGRTDDHNASGKNQLRYLKTRTGHLLCFDESESDAGIILQDIEKRRFEIQTKKKKVIISDEKENKIQLDGSNIEINTKETSVKMSPQDIKIDAKSAVTLTVGGSKIEMKDSTLKTTISGNSLEISGAKAEISVGSSQITISKSGVVINGSASIQLGSGAAEALIKGTTFLTLFNTHMHPTAMGPSGPPMIPLNPTVLSMKVKTS